MGSILIIDDEKNIRTMIKDILEDEKFICHVAQDWDEGKKVLLQNKIDVMLLDVWLPKVGGIDILKNVHHPNIIYLKEIFETPKKLNLVMELVTGGELFDKIVEKGSYAAANGSTFSATLRPSEICSAS